MVWKLLTTWWQVNLIHSGCTMRVFLNRSYQAYTHCVLLWEELTWSCIMSKLHGISYKWRQVFCWMTSNSTLWDIIYDWCASSCFWPHMHANTKVVRSNFLRLQFVLSGILHVVEQGMNLQHGARNNFPFLGILYPKNSCFWGCIMTWFEYRLFSFHIILSGCHHSKRLNLHVIPNPWNTRASHCVLQNYLQLKPSYCIFHMGRWLCYIVGLTIIFSHISWMKCIHSPTDSGCFNMIIENIL